MPHLLRSGTNSAQSTFATPAPSAGPQQHERERRATEHHRRPSSALVARGHVTLALSVPTRPAQRW